MSNSFGSQPSTIGTTSQLPAQLVRSTGSLDTVSHQVDRDDNKRDQSNNQDILRNAGEQQVNSVINITNSNDIVIGPMMQYHGEVTIYQYMDATSAGPFSGKALEIGSKVHSLLKLNPINNVIFPKI